MSDVHRMVIASMKIEGWAVKEKDIEDQCPFDHATSFKNADIMIQKVWKESYYCVQNEQFERCRFYFERWYMEDAFSAHTVSCK